MTENQAVHNQGDIERTVASPRPSPTRCYRGNVTSAVIDQVQVPGARLYTETRGAGPLLLFIVGGNGDPAVFSAAADRLAADYTVVTYTRRGFAGSPVDGAVDDANRIAADVEDAAALIARHGGGPARVFGTSSGAIVALDLVHRRPDLVSTVVVHEPPILELLADSDAWVARFAGIFATYEKAGLWPAMAQFGEAVGLGRPPGVAAAADPATAAAAAAAIAAMQARATENMTFWMEHEFRQYPAYHPDLDALRAVAGKIVPAGGRDSREKGSMPYLPVVTLAGRLGLDVAEFRGGHVGYAEHPGDFAARLGALL
jgi:pimeloyl-ACP methyl ester carboxylesterase